MQQSVFEENSAYVRISCAAYTLNLGQIVEHDINGQTAHYSLGILEIIDALMEGDHFGDFDLEKKIILKRYSRNRSF